jgi:HPt (histidine-containing phosphotransfer) domain-containing protein
MELFDGDPVQVEALLDTALGLMAADLERIARAAAANDWQTCGEAAHRLKGTSGGIGALQVMAIGAMLQQAATHNPGAVDAAVLASLAGAVACVRTEWEAQRGRLLARPAL